MNKATLKALKASIAHWRRMATGRERKGEIPTDKYCALCQKFNTSSQFGLCNGCPVKEETGRSLCNGTPFHEAYNLSWEGSAKQFQSAAKKELAFLESLLPKL